MLRVVGAVAMAAAIVWVPCWANSEEVDIGKKISVRAGLFVPTDSDTADLLGSTWPEVHVGLTVYKSESSAHLLELGLIQSHKADLSDLLEGVVPTGTQVTARAQIIPLTFTFLAKPAPEAKTYYGGGIGAYFVNVDAAAIVEGERVSASDSQTRLGLQLILGITLSQDYIAEMRYTRVFLPGEQVDDLDGFSFVIGARY